MASPSPPPSFASTGGTLSKDEVERFSRQVMVEGIGADGMARIRRAHVCCVGAGGLGSTISLYLAAAGVGRLTIVDFDDVELSNLHRQVIHTAARVGARKVDSAREACLAIYPAADIRAVPVALDVSNAEATFAGCDVVVDGSDNVAARYLINDAAVRCATPLVSGSAMRWDGQLTVYGYKGGPCYRCLFPVPPPAAAVGSCNDSGVMGPVPGMIGCLQALETLKVLAGCGAPLSGRMMVFDGLRMSMRVVQLRSRQADCCPSCGDAAVRQRTQEASLAALALTSRPEYISNDSCGSGGAAARRLALMSDSLHCSAADFGREWKDRHGGGDPADAVQTSGSTAMICADVRVPIQYGMCHLPGSHSLPLPDIQRWARGDGAEPNTFVPQWTRFLEDALGDQAGQHFSSVKMFLICRRGIASVQATELLLEHLAVIDNGDATTASNITVNLAGTQLPVTIVNVDGGLNAYHREVDREFPFY